jgi:HK97 gp10 family phage protein
MGKINIQRTKESKNIIVEGEWNGEEVKIQGKRVIGKSVLETGIIVEGQAKLLAPVDTGRLAGSIITKVADGAGTRVEAPATIDDEIKAPTKKNMAYVGTALEYAPYVEFGTVRMSAQPFLRPALDLARGRTLTIVKKNAKLEFKDYLK